MRITFAPPAEPVTGAAVIGVFADGLAGPAATRLDRGWLQRAMAASRFTGEHGTSVTVLAPAGLSCSRVLVLGLGKPDDLTPARARALGGTIAAALLCSGETEADIALDLDVRHLAGAAADLAAEVAAGLVLRAHRPHAAWHTVPEPDRQPSLTAVLLRVGAPEAAERAWASRQPVIAGALLARNLVAEPANVLTPEAFIARARTLEDLGCTTEVLDEDALVAAGLTLLVAVGRGSAVRPRLLLVRWPGTEPATEPPVVLVGKGITFDSGGISIKPAEALHEMKGDMAGAAAVLGVLHGLAGRRSPLPAVGVIALAENMPGPEATRPGDVITSHAGLTVEIRDTDAEGRLVLADALSYAIRRFRPRRIIDLATLTGAIITSLGRHHAGLFTPDDTLAAGLLAAGRESGEAVWRMPLVADLDEDLKTEAADLHNAVFGKLVPDALHAARFLHRFVERAGQPAGEPSTDGGSAPAWAHLDIAGVAETAEDTPLAVKGPTGFGVLLLDRLLAGWER